MTRRLLLLSMTAPAAAQKKPVISLRALNHMTLAVRDVQRSVLFYQTLFGLPVQARQGPTVLLRIGTGPQFLALNPAGPNGRTDIHHWCATTEEFHIESLIQTLVTHGIPRDKVRVRMRPATLGGAKDGTPELYATDPDGLVMQLQHSSYCGGAGALGEVCTAPLEMPAQSGRLRIRDFHHFLFAVPVPKRSGTFYRELFGADGAVTPRLRFVEAPQPAIAHAALAMDKFHMNTVVAALEASDARDIQTAQDAVTFSDPDGIRIQLR